MSAAATAAGYLYASGRLRGRNAREGEAGQGEEADKAKQKRRDVKVAVYDPREAPREGPREGKPREPREPRPREAQGPAAAPRAKTAPKIQYRTRRWKPE